MEGLKRSGASVLALSAVAIFAAGYMAGGPAPAGGAVPFPASAQAMAAVREDEPLPDIIERVSPSVVMITSRKIVENRFRNPFLEDPFWRRFFDIPRQREQQNLGSGVIVSGDGYILTNNHLVGGASEVEVKLFDGTVYDAEIVGTDRQSDVAVLKIDTGGDALPVMEMGNSSTLRLGETVIAIGYPFDIGLTVTRGIVSALGKSLKLVAYEDFIQTDAAINPGNSGGALINMRGELIGINTAIASRSGGSHGIGFAIPIDFARTIMSSLVDFGKVVRGYVGIDPQDITPDMIDYFELEDSEGVIVTQVAEDTPAEKAGVRQGDVIVEFDGEKVRGEDQFRMMAAGRKPGSKVEVVVIRDGERRKLELTMGERPELREETEESVEDISPLFLGTGLQTLGDEQRERLEIPSQVSGVMVTDVQRGTPAADAGLRSGDVIVEVNRAKVEDLSDFREIMDGYGDDKVMLVIFRGGGYFYTIVRK